MEKSVECSNNFCRLFPALKSVSWSLSKRISWLLPNLYAYIAHSSESFFYSSKIQRGVSSARSDDTKSLKGAVLDWIFPRDGDMRNVLPMDPLPQPLSRNVKTNRGFHHPITGALLCPAGLDYNNAERVS
jgi:hypothetical protein